MAEGGDSFMMNHGESPPEQIRREEKKKKYGGEERKSRRGITSRDEAAPTLNDKCLTRGGLWEVHTNK